MGGFTNPAYTVTCVSAYSLIDTNDLVGCTVFKQTEPHATIKEVYLYLSYVRVKFDNDQLFNLMNLDDRNPGECPFGERVDGSCKSNCEYLADQNVTRELTWDAYIYGNDVKWGCYGEQPPNLCKMNLIRKTAENPAACNGSNSDITAGTRCEGTFRHTSESCSVEGFGGGTPPSPDDGNGDGSGDNGSGNGDGSGGNDSDGDGVPDYEYPKGEVPDVQGETIGDLMAQNRGGFNAVNKTNWHGFKRIQDALSSVILDDRKRQEEFNELFTSTMNDLRNVIMLGNTNGGNSGGDSSTPDFSSLEQKQQLTTNAIYNVSGTIGSEIHRNINNLNNSQDARLRDIEEEFSALKRALENQTYEVTQTVSDSNSNVEDSIIDLTSAFEARDSGQLRATKEAFEKQTQALKESTDSQTTTLQQNFDNVVDAINSLKNSGDGGSSGGNGGSDGGDDNGNCTGDDCPPDGNSFKQPQAGDKFGSNWLISEETIGNTESEIEQLKTDLDDQLGKFKTLFELDTSQFHSGHFVEHHLDLIVNGKAQSFKTSVFTGLRDNADFISKIIFFICVLIGLKIIFKWSD